MPNATASLEARTGTSRCQTAMNFIKCCVGAGSFSLPFAFIKGGLVASVFLCLCIGALAAYTIVLLGWVEEHAWSQLTPQQQQQQMARHAGHKGLSYPAIGRIVAPHWVCRCSRGASSAARGPPAPSSAGTAPGAPADRESFQQLAAEGERGDRPASSTPPRGVWGGAPAAPGSEQCNIMSASIATAIVATSVGVGAAYLDFIASTLVSIFPSSELGQTEFMLLTLLPVLPLAMVSSYKYLAFTSILGDIAVAAGIVVVILFGAFGQSDSSQSTSVGGGAGGGNGTAAVPPLAPGQWEDGEAPLFNPAGVFQVVGSVAFLFAVHIVVLPVVQSMRERAAFGTVVYASMGGVAVTNTVFGVVCAVLFASLTQPNVIDNLDDGPVSVTVKVLLCVDLLFTVPMVLAAGRQVLERAVVSRYRHEKQLRKALSGEGGAGGVALPPPTGASRPQRSASQSLMAEHDQEHTMQHEHISAPVASAGAHVAGSAGRAETARAARAPPPPTETAPLRAGGAGAGALAPNCGREAFITALIRLSLVLVMAAAALSIPNFEMMVTLVGGLVNSFTGFVFPPLLFLALTRNSPGHKPSMWSTIGHGAIAVFGVLAAVLTTVFTIREMVT